MAEVQQGDRTVISRICVGKSLTARPTWKRSRNGGGCRARGRGRSRALATPGNSGGATLRIVRTPNTRRTLIHAVATLLCKRNALRVSEVENWKGTVIARIRPGYRLTASAAWKWSWSGPGGHATAITFRIPCGRGLFVTPFVVYRILRQEGLEWKCDQGRGRAAPSRIRHSKEQLRRRFQRPAPGPHFLDLVCRLGYGLRI